MCARRFLLAIFVLPLLVVAGAFAIFEWGGQLLLKSATPHGHFEAKTAGNEADYALPASWIAGPAMGDNPSHWLPDGAPSVNGAQAAAVFFIHPTTYLERDRWNAALHDRHSHDARD